MSKVTFHKERTVEEVQAFLDGAISGSDIKSGVFGLVGKTLIFTSPASHTVTFSSVVTTTRDKSLLLPTDIKAQIEAVMTTCTVYFLYGRLFIREATPASGVAITAAGTANDLLGFDHVTATAGRVIAGPGGTAPRLVNAYSNGDNMHVLIIEEP